MIANKKYNFWINDISVLYQNEQYLNFIPTIKMSRIEQLNAITRLCIYCLILASLFQCSSLYFKIPLIVIFVTYLIFVVFDLDNAGKSDEFDRMRNLSESTNNDESFQTTNNKSTNNPEIQVGVFDETNNLKFDTYQSSKKKKSKHFSYDEIDKFQKHTCKRPTEDNPFMNPTLNDFTKEFPPQACNIEDDDIKTEIDDNFNKNLFKDISDLFEKQNSQRQFYSIPGSSVPDTITFANWLYSPENTCKSNQVKCVGHENLRYSTS